MLCDLNNEVLSVRLPRTPIVLPRKATNRDYITLPPSLNQLFDVKTIMFGSRLQSGFVLLLALGAGCLAPKVGPSNRSQGFGHTISAGAVTPRIQTFLSRLQERGLLSDRMVKYWLDTSQRPEYNRLIINHFFEDGRQYQPLILPLGESIEGSHLAAAIAKPDEDFAEFLARFHTRTRDRGWRTQSNVILLELRSNEEPRAVGVLRLKLHQARNQMLASGQMMPLNHFEQMHGVTNILRVVQHHP